LRYSAELLGAPHERRGLQRDIADMDGLEGREVGRKISVSELIDQLWLSQVAQPELAEPLQGEPAAQPPADEVPVVLVTSTWPPCAAPFNRAQRLIGPWSMRSLPRARASPVCSPIRTRSTAPSGHGSA
jgi:hypothetical protein